MSQAKPRRMQPSLQQQWHVEAGHACLLRRAGKAAALPDFAVNAVCPGWVRTDMGGSNATRSVAEGAAGILWLATDAPQSQTGKFFRDRKVIPW